MRWLQKLERKLSPYAIPNLMYYIIGITSAVYIVDYIFPVFLYQYLAFIPHLVMQGQIWRVITFIFIPPSASIFMIAFVMYFYYMIGTTLESEWGTVKFNLYYLFGIIGTIIAAFITGFGTSIYLNLSMFLAFAYLFPNVEILLFFILPVKIKWLAYLNWGYFIISLIFGSMGVRIATVMSLINFFLFFGKDFIDYLKHQKKYGSTRRNFKREMKKFRR
ncbi:rhomboid family intramembrane serine protease [Irregularibacter muris]|uniref:Rhomboid family intramembrane serine protease n=1 Tax=Irregularibacter muris TaxID=1796619 RepID=A0AAE3HDU6_9FIRM|nr:rhomboid family intramembrane serine protease [Irregularibacter muris]MCR1897549.1 rhomboid family intramembrane serine protease [Irregularibacter muris]